MRDRTKIIIPAVIGALFLFLISEPGVITLFYISSAFQERIPTEEEVPTDLILNRTSALPEVKVFLDRYPNATVFPRGMDHFATIYQIRTADLTNETLDYTAPYTEYLSLNVRLDSEGFPTSSVLWCTTQKYGQHKIEVNGNNISEHLDNEICRIL